MGCMPVSLFAHEKHLQLCRACSHMTVLEFFTTAAWAGFIAADACLFRFFRFLLVPDPMHHVCRGTFCLELFGHVIHVGLHMSKKLFVACTEIAYPSSPSAVLTKRCFGQSPWQANLNEQARHVAASPAFFSWPNIACLGCAIMSENERLRIFPSK